MNRSFFLKNRLREARGREAMAEEAGNLLYPRKKPFKIS